MLFLTKLFGKAADKLYEGFVPAAGSFMYTLGKIACYVVMAILGFCGGCVIRGVIDGIIAVIQAG